MYKYKLKSIMENILKKQKTLYCIAIILWVLSTVFIIRLLTAPLKITELTKENSIILETNFSYQASMMPFALNPAGGITDIEKSTFTKVTKDITLHIKSTINSEKPIKTEGIKKVILKIKADELWEKEYELSPETNFNTEGSENQIFDDDFDININIISSFISEMEEDINMRSGTYIVEVTPIIVGTIIYNGREVPIELNAKTFVQYSEAQIILSEENAFLNETPITSTLVIPQYFNLFEIKLPIIIAKVAFSLLYIIFTIFVIIITRHILAGVPKISEVQHINKKYRTRLIPILERFNASVYEKIILDSFRALVKISDEKDTIILYYQSENNAYIEYYVIDRQFVFVYQIYNLTMEKQNLPESSELREVLLHD